MNAFAEFTPKHFEKALDIARHIGSYAKLHFTADFVRMTVIDPAKAMYMDTHLIPTTYKTDKDLAFGINLNMMYKLIKSLDNNLPVEIEASDDKMTITQIGHRHEFANQTLQYDVPEMKTTIGPLIKLDTKTLQKYIRTLSNVSPIFEIAYDSSADILFLESVNSMYRTVFAINTENSKNEAWPQPYKKQFMTKFVEASINPSLGDTIQLELGEFLQVRYEKEGLHVALTIANYTEG